VILRRDHVAGGVFVVAGVLVLAVSQDLPFGRLASPGAGMLPVVVTSLMILFGLAILLRAGSSPPMAQISWGDFPHAVRVTAVAAGAWRLCWALRGAAGAGGKHGRTPLELSARARRTLECSVAADQQFEALSAAPAGVFVQWHVDAIIARPADIGYVDRGAARRERRRKGIFNRSRRMPDK
jgi:hypothetical protein